MGHVGEQAAPVAMWAPAWWQSPAAHVLWGAALSAAALPALREDHAHHAMVLTLMLLKEVIPGMHHMLADDVLTQHAKRYLHLGRQSTGH